MDRVEEMPVFQLFFVLALDVEKATRGFGPDFRWLRIQSLRSSEGVCSNMGEGFYSQYSTEYLQSLYRCRREARETTVHIRYAAAIGQLTEAVGSNLLARYDEGSRQLGALITSIERKIDQRGKSKSAASYLREHEEEYDALPANPQMDNDDTDEPPSIIDS